MQSRFPTMLAASCLLLCSCSFDPSTLHSANGDGAIEAADAAGDLDSMAPVDDADTSIPPDADIAPDAATDAATDASLTAPVCDPALTELVACYEFEDGAGATSLADSSMYGNNAVASGALFVAGMNGSALQSSTSLSAPVADSSSLDVPTTITMEAWIQPDGSVTAGRQGLFDNQGQYGFFIVAQDALRCTASSLAAASANDILKIGQWQHVACVYDGASLQLYLDGVVVGKTDGTGTISTGGSTGSVIAGDSPDGDEFVGKMDNLRIWSTAKTATELCKGANLICL